MEKLDDFGGLPGENIRDFNDDGPEEPSEHGMAYACYLGGSGEPYYKPNISCDCGWSSGRVDSWEEAGRLFDEHLSATEES